MVTVYYIFIVYLPDMFVDLNKLSKKRFRQGCTLDRRTEVNKVDKHRKLPPILYQKCIYFYLMRYP